MPYDVVIVGTGHGGAQTAIALRERKFTGTIAMIGEEVDPPYERPPLSKDYLSLERDFDDILIRPARFWEDRGIDIISGERVVAVDPAARRIVTAGGRELHYGNLVWAAGGQARRLDCEGGALTGVHTVRTRADVDLLRSELPAVDRVVVIGGGYIGLEAASALRKLGKAVTLLVSQDRVLARVTGEALSRFYEAEHRKHGVDLRLGVTADTIEGANGRVTGVRLTDGSVVEAQMAIAGIGIIPAVAPLIAAGAKGEAGVRIDARGRTSLPHIHAVGDCAEYPNAYADGAVVRVESVQNANDLAAVVASDLTGGDASYDAVPWFWSNQYDLRLQTLGLSTGYDEAVVRGDVADRSFSIIYLRGGRVIALDCVNAARDYAQGKELVRSGARIPADILRDPAISLKQMRELQLAS